MSMSYHHTQHGYWHYLLFAIAVATFGGAWLVHSNFTITTLLVATAACFAFCGLSFASLTISDEGDCLALRFGPLPVFFKRIRYADITRVAIGRTTIIDGWGIHYMPGRGRTYNIWGFACVKLTLNRKVIRVGTDDAEGLAKFLSAKTSSGGLAA